jgi:hypothetical protein
MHIYFLGRYNMQIYTLWCAALHATLLRQCVSLRWHYTSIACVAAILSQYTRHLCYPHGVAMSLCAHGFFATAHAMLQRCCCCSARSGAQEVPPKKTVCKASMTLLHTLK